MLRKPPLRAESAPISGLLGQGCPESQREKPCQSRFRSSAGDSDVWHHLLICFSGCLSNVLSSSSRKHKAISGLEEMIMKKGGCFHNP